jgi:surface antigen
MAKRITVLLLAMVVLGALPQLPGSASAGPKGKEKRSDSQHGNHPPAKHAHRDLQHVKGGPPPWAPAHGYRRKHGGERVAYLAPFGINAGTCNRELLGAVLGGSAGGLLASELVSGGDPTPAIIGGTLMGILLGGAIGRSMDQLDHHCVGQILEHAPPRETVAWINPDSGAAYEVTPIRTYQEADDRYCREYQTAITIDGKPERGYGSACRQPDGSWQRSS